MLSVCWHYLVCAALLYACWRCGKSGRPGAVVLLTLLMVAVSVAGFFLVYIGPFAQSGKTFAMYVTRYGAYTIPIFAFPLVGLVLAIRSRRA